MWGVGGDRQSQRRQIALSCNQNFNALWVSTTTNVDGFIFNVSFFENIHLHKQSSTRLTTFNMDPQDPIKSSQIRGLTYVL